MTTDLRLLIAGGLTILAGYLSGQPVCMVVGVVMVGAAVYRDLLALAAQPVYVVLNRIAPGNRITRGGLGAQRAAEAVSGDPRCLYPGVLCETWGCVDPHPCPATRLQGRSGRG